MGNSALNLVMNYLADRVVILYDWEILTAIHIIEHFS